VSLLRILGSFDRDVTEKAERRILRDSRVLVEGERSVEPPTNHGCFLAIAFSTLPEESLLAIPFASGGNIGISESQPCGGSRRWIARVSAASSGCCDRAHCRDRRRSSHALRARCASASL